MTSYVLAAFVGLVIVFAVILREDAVRSGFLAGFAAILFCGLLVALTNKIVEAIKETKK